MNSRHRLAFLLRAASFLLFGAIAALPVPVLAWGSSDTRADAHDHRSTHDSHVSHERGGGLALGPEAFWDTRPGYYNGPGPLEALEKKMGQKSVPINPRELRELMDSLGSPRFSPEYVPDKEFELRNLPRGGRGRQHVDLERLERAHLSASRATYGSEEWERAESRVRDAQRQMQGVSDPDNSYRDK